MADTPPSGGTDLRFLLGRSELDGLIALVAAQRDVLARSVHEVPDAR